jgi:NAD(P)-dependent dehydrogenase (short-subunit alcohol dehydrogenase family)
MDQHPAAGGTELEGRAVIVTGGVRGIGLAIARELLAAGAIVGVGSQDQRRAEAVARELGGDVVPLGMPLEDPDAPQRLVSAFVERAGRLDGLVNNAGISVIAPAAELRRDDFRRVLDVNLTATFLCAQAAAAAMEEGAIVNVSSMSALQGVAGRAAYSASKAGVIALTRVLAVELAPAIRVCCVVPGPVATEMLREQAALGNIDLARMERRTPLGRIAEPREVAAAVRFLLGPGASFITGEALTVDGGWLAYGAP